MTELEVFIEWMDRNNYTFAQRTNDYYRTSSIDLQNLHEVWDDDILKVFREWQNNGCKT